MTIQLWQHISGETYAVEVDETGAILGAAGPLHHSEFDAALGGDVDFDSENVDDIRADAARFRVKAMSLEVGR